MDVTTVKSEQSQATTVFKANGLIKSANIHVASRSSSESIEGNIESHHLSWSFEGDNQEKEENTCKASSMQI